MPVSVYAGGQGGVEGFERVGGAFLDRLAVQAPGRVGDDAELLEDGGGDVHEPGVGGAGAGRDARALGEDEGAPFLDRAAAVAAGVGVAVVGGDDDRPAFGGVRGPGLDRGEEAAEVAVLDGDGLAVGGACGPGVVAGDVGLAEVDEEHVRVLVPEDRLGLGGDGGVVAGVAVAVAVEDELGVGARGDGALGVQGLPVDGGVGGELGADLGEAGEEAGVLRVVLPGEGVLPDAVLVGPDAGGDRRPAGAGRGGGHRVGVQQGGAVRPVRHHRREVRGVGGGDDVVAQPVHADDEHLVLAGAVRERGRGMGGGGGGERGDGGRRGRGGGGGEHGASGQGHVFLQGEGGPNGDGT